MPDQATFDRAVALAHLVTGRIKPKSHLELPVPPVLAAGLTTPLPASLTGDARDVDLEVQQKRAEEAWDAVDAAVSGGWALGATWVANCFFSGLTKVDRLHWTL
jgi:metaxin